jgi:hypothetical protein
MYRSIKDYKITTINLEIEFNLCITSTQIRLIRGERMFEL